MKNEMYLIPETKVMTLRLSGSLLTGSVTPEGAQSEGYNDLGPWGGDWSID